MKINKDTTCCFTGHRPDKLFGYNPSSEGNLKMLRKLRGIIEEIINKNNVDTFITGMALGIDQWAARIVLALKKNKYPNLKIVAAIPCTNHSSKWIKGSQLEWQDIVEQCDYVHYVSKEEYTPWCMQDRNKWMVDNSSYVIAVHDGSKGGTYNCIQYAKNQNSKIITLHPKTLEITN